MPAALTPQPVTSPHLGLRYLLAVSPMGAAGTAAARLANGAFYGVGAVFAHRVGLNDIGVAGFMSAVIFGGSRCSGLSAISPIGAIGAPCLR